MWGDSMRSIKVQLIVILNCISILSILLVGGFFIYSLHQDSGRQIEAYRNALRENADRELRVQVETAVSFIEKVYKDQQSGKLTEAQAKLQAADFVRQLRYDKDSYFWIDTVEGVNVVLLGQETEGKLRIADVDNNGVAYIKEIIKNGQKDGGGYSDYSFPKPGGKETLPKRAYALSFAPYHWIIGTGMWIDNIEKAVEIQEAATSQSFYRNLWLILGFMVVVQLLVMLFALYIGNNFVKPIIAATKRINKFARGDFSDAGESESVIRQDEFGEMTKAFASLNKKMNTLVRKIADSAQHVAAASEQLTASADQSAVVGAQVATSITEVAAASEKQLTGVRSTTQIVEKMSAGMEEVAGNVVTSHEQVEEAAEAARKGSTDIESAVQQMSLIETAVNNSAVVVTKLGERSKEIGTIVDTISGIAGQTNLLALNAAIEAARAGEQGKGFAVVAEEVRKLAEQSREAAKQIAQLISEIQTDTDEAVLAMGEGTKQVKIGAEVVTNAGGSFKIISNLVNCIVEQSEQMGTVITDMAMDTDTIVCAIQDIDKMSRNVAAESETVSAATEEQTASMDEIATASQALATMAQDLQNAINKFHV